MYRNIRLETSPFLNQKIYEARERLPRELKMAPWSILDHGVKPLVSDVELDCYLAAYGSLHSRKLFWALNSFPLCDIQRTSFELIDWGCGQGIASVCFLNYIQNKNQYVLNNLSRVTLIEPSKLALERAVQYVDTFLNYKIAIKSYDQYLPSSSDTNLNQIKAFRAVSPIVVHLLSNILDITNIDLSEFARKASASTSSKHIFVCVGPTRFQTRPRFDAFFNAFETALLIGQGTKENLYSPSSDRQFGGIFSIFSVPALPIGQARVIRENVRTFSAGFESDAFPLNEHSELKQLNFEVSTLFDFSVYPEHEWVPHFSVLSNLVSRGLPTRTSQAFETSIQQSFGLTQRCENRGSFWYAKDKLCDDLTSKTIRQMGLAIARLEKVFFEALLAKRLELDAKVWDILVIERDVECASIAFQDIREMLGHLSAMCIQPFNVPKINLTKCSSNQEVLNQKFDAVFDIAMRLEDPERDVINLGVLRHVDDGNYFKIRDTKLPNCKIHLHSSERIIYRKKKKKTVDSRHLVIEEMQIHLKYFLQLLFRKIDFRDGQLPILSRALQLKNVIGLLPTGGGKSLTFQLAALLQPGTTVVIDPLTTLMQDQVDGLKRQKIDCCACIHSGVPSSQQQTILEHLVSGGILFLFVSPERLCVEKFRQTLRAMYDAGIYFAYGVIDEVHCVSEWGHTFRTTYLHVGRNLMNLLKPKSSKVSGNTISLFGLTATASFDVLADVERELAGPHAFVLDPDTTVRYENCNRLELQYLVKRMSTRYCRDKWAAYDRKRSELPNIVKDLSDWFEQLQTEDALKRIKERFIERENLDQTIADEIHARDIRISVKKQWVNNPKSETAAIFFCPHRVGKLGVLDNKTTSGIASLLKHNLNMENLPAFFVGGDNFCQIKQFLSGENNLMVSTKAFGMGIDKPNVRFTIHLCHPDSLESFIQEAGRAGRDRHMALSVILYSPALEGTYSTSESIDREIQNYFLGNNFKGSDHEKRMLWNFLTKYEFDEATEQNFEESFDENWFPQENNDLTTSVCRFFSRLTQAKPNELVRATISYERNFPIFKSSIQKELQDNQKNPLEEDFVEDLNKVIYRLSCIGVIEDFTRDWGKKTITICARAKAEGGYYAGLELFLQRYYSPERAKIEAQKARSYRGQNELQKCLGYLTEFVYEKISNKRYRAVSDMELFCELATQSNSSKDWLETNEDLKDFIFYYFNSKFARHSYQVEYEDGTSESFSLTSDTQQGKKADPYILFKYMRVIDDDVVGAGSPKDNIKHLLGAARLIRRGLTDTNGVIDFLIAFCLIFLGTEGSKSLDQELINSYIAGYLDMYERFDNCSDFYAFIDQFKSELEVKKRMMMSSDIEDRLEILNAMAELKIHRNYLTGFSSDYLKN